jgi:hypothetical protein
MSYDRQDWYIGRLHVIRRPHRESAQYGLLGWGGRRFGAFPTLDIWVGQVLWTVRDGGAK